MDWISSTRMPFGVPLFAVNTKMNSRAVTGAKVSVRRMIELQRGEVDVHVHDTRIIVLKDEVRGLTRTDVGVTQNI